MIERASALMVVMALALSGCGGGTGSGEAPASQAAADASAAPSQSASLAAAPGDKCADGGETLALTGFCKTRAVNYLQMDSSASPSAPDGCEWQVAETELPGGDVLLYRALKCGKKQTRIEFSGGAHRGELQLVESAMEGKLSEPRPIVYFYVADGDAAKAVTARARESIQAKAEAAKCNARPAKVDGWPKDAMVVDNGERSADGDPVAVCGDLGYFDEANRFWRVVQGYAWFFDFGQDLVEIDPGSITLMSQGENGEYRTS